MRVLFVVDNLELGGTRESLLHQISGLDQERFEVGILTLADDLRRYSHLLPRHVTGLAAFYPLAARYGVVDYLADGLLLRAARKSGGPALAQMEGFAPHLLHFRTHPRELALGILAERSFTTTLVFTDGSVRIGPTDYSPHARLLLRVAYRRLYRRYNVISVGPTVARLNERAGLLNRSRKHALIERQIDLGKYCPSSIERPDERVEIIYVGRIHPAKGVDTLIRAFAGLDVKRPVRLMIVGPDAMDGAMQTLATRCVSEPLEVKFYGERTDIPTLLRQASIGVLPSRREGLSGSLQEQMASALAVVASDIPGTEDLICDGANGLVVPADDVDAWTGALQRLVDDIDLRRRLGAAARESIERRTQRSTGPQLADFYETLIATRGDT